MSESQRKLLVRELGEITAGHRVTWSARALHRAARIMLRISSDPDDRGIRCCGLALAMTDAMDDFRPENMQELTTLLDTRDLDAIVDLESRAWLLGFASTEGLRGEPEAW